MLAFTWRDSKYSIESKGILQILKVKQKQFIKVWMEMPRKIISSAAIICGNV